LSLHDRLFAALAEFERELIVERTRAGIAAARARGQHCGRRPKLTPKEIRLLHKAMGDRRKRVIDVIAEFGISRATAYRYIGPKGELREFAKRVLEMQGEGRGKRS
jgi:DNA invertase Pin-like site-specific DNA recombinase